MWQMAKRTFTREIELEAVRLVEEGCVEVSQASRDLNVHIDVFRK